MADIASNQDINKKYTALAQAALRVSTPHVRDMATIGGNLAQLHRCWYFRKPDNRFHCIRKSIDSSIVNCAVMVGGGAPRIALNAVAPKPCRAPKAEVAIAGKPINEANAEAAGTAAVRDAAPLNATKYKVQIAKTLVKQALLATV